MTTKLDRSRHFGQVYGPADHAYEQDGKLFDHEGNELVPAGQKKAAQPKSDPPPPGNEKEGVIVIEGKSHDLAKLEAPELHVLATQAGLELHPRTGAVKVTAALLEWYAAQPKSETQLDSQLEG